MFGKSRMAVVRFGDDRGGVLVQRTLVAAWYVLALSPQVLLAGLSFSGDVILNTGFPTAPAQIGRTTVGSLQLDNGSAFSSGLTQFGATPTGIGFGTVAGPRTTWSMGAADVGLAGIGRLDIQGGGIVDVMSVMRIGVNPGSHGTVAVDGPGSTLQIRGKLDIGGSQSGSTPGLLQISNGAIVNAVQPAVQSQTFTGVQGRVLLDGGLLRMNSLSHNGVIMGSGELALMSSLTIAPQGRLGAGAGDHLVISGGGTFGFPNKNLGIIAADGGEIEFYRSIDNSRFGPGDAGEITLRNGTLRINSTISNESVTLRNSGVVASIGGENHLYGTVESGVSGEPIIAEIAVTNQSTMIFHDDVSIRGGTLTVFPRSKATLLEDLTLGSASMLLADIAGSDVDTDYGQIEVVGNVQLGGGLRPVLSDGFVPEAYDTWQILKSVGGITGSIALAETPALPGRLVWDVDIDTNQVLLSVVPAPTGDYNLDGSVDSADYSVWQDTRGATGDGLAADGNLDGAVDAADYAVWKSNFGRTVDSGAGATAAVPEPAAFTLLLIGLMAIRVACSRGEGTVRSMVCVNMSQA